ncbi:MAG: glycosyltransferase family 9 protein [Rhodocyclaceae bacterium]
MGLRLRKNLLHAALRLIHAADRRQPDAARLGGASIRRILAISCTAIGDTLLSTPALRSLRLAYPNAQISLLLNRNYATLFANNPDIDEIIPYAGGYRRFFRLAWLLNRRRFDLALILHGNEPQATPLAYLSGADFRFKLPNDNDFRFLLSNAEPVRRWSDFAHGIDQRLAVAALAGGAPTDRSMTLTPSPAATISLDQRMAARGIAPGAPLIGFQAGASTLSRRWAADRFVELGQRLLASRPDAWIVLTGAPGERPLAEKIAAGIGDARVWIAAGEPSLAELPALMQRLALLLTGDTGPMHMAIAVGTPVVALFAVSDWRRSGPADGFTKHVVIQKWITCKPCLSKRCPYAEPLCMANIGVDEVEQAIIGKLDGAPGGVFETPAPTEEAPA